MNWMGLGFLFQAKDQASAVIRQIEGSLGSLGETAGTVTKALAATYAAHKAFSIGLETMKDAFGLAKEAGDFQQKLGYLRATAGGTADQFEAMRETAIRMGATTFFNPTQAVEGMTALAQEGYTAEQSINKVSSALRLAGVSLGQLNAETSASFLAKIERSFGEHDANAVANVVAKMTKTSALNFGEVPGMFSRVQRGASMQQSLASVSAALMIAKNFITSSETASTTIGDIMLSLTEGKKINALQAMSGVQFRDAAGRMKDFLPLMAEINASPMWNRLDEQVRRDALVKLFGRRQQAGLFGVFQTIREGFTDQDTGRIFKGVEGMKALVEEQERAKKQDIIGEYELERINSFGGMLDMLNAKWTTLRVNIVGEALANAFRPFALVINRALEGLILFLQKIPSEIRTAIAATFMFATAIGTAVAGVAVLTAGFVGLAALMTAIGAPILAALAPPILAAIALTTAFGALFAALGAGLYAGWTSNINGMKDQIQGFFSKVSLGFAVLKQLFAEGGTWGQTHADIMKDENSGLREFLMDVWMLLGRIKNFGLGVWEGFRTALMEVNGPLGELMRSLGGLLGIFQGTETSAADNEAAFKAWGQIGKQLGEILADLANVGIALLTQGIELLIDALQAAKDVLAFFGYGGKYGSSTAAADMNFYSKSWGALTGKNSFGDAATAFSDAEKTKLRNFQLSEHPLGENPTSHEWDEWVRAHTGFRGVWNDGAWRFGHIRDDLIKEGPPQERSAFATAGPNIALAGQQSMLPAAKQPEEQNMTPITFAPTTVVKVGDDQVAEFWHRYQRDHDARSLNAFTPVLGAR